MIDTNVIIQATQDVAVVKTTVAANWPAICAAALWIRTELKAFNTWAVRLAEYCIAHGGLISFLGKIFWNPPVPALPLNDGRPQGPTQTLTP